MAALSGGDPLSTRRLFIYYRVSADRAREALAPLQAMQAQACALQPGLQAELLRRPEEKDGLQTWMEVYSHPDGVSESLQAWLAEEERRALVPAFVPPSYVEIFVPCAS